jgi:deoxyribodipyrimidine photo-lyase
MLYDASLAWLRNNLRTDDNAVLARALRGSKKVYCVYCFDREELDAIPLSEDRKVEFLWQSVAELKSKLETWGTRLWVLDGRARDVLPALAEQLEVNAVFAAEEYAPAPRHLMDAVQFQLELAGIRFRPVKDYVVFEKNEVVNDSKRPFVDFPEYKKAWMARLEPGDYATESVDTLQSKLAPSAEVPGDFPTLAALGFSTGLLAESPVSPGESGAWRQLTHFMSRLGKYQHDREALASQGTSRLSVHVKFGTISIRELTRQCLAHRGAGAKAFLNEIVRRDFFQQILYHYPRVLSEPYRENFRKLPVDNDMALFRAWQEGQTGIPIVDAGMRELRSRGYLPHRARLLTASFLVKNLHCAWQLGERHFAEQLLDYDPASNNAGWQWVASTGVDAQPWKQIYNPVAQGERMDPTGAYIRRYIPELEHVPSAFIHTPWKMSAVEQGFFKCKIGEDYPAPIVDLDQTRNLSLERYAKLVADSIA